MNQLSAAIVLVEHDHKLSLRIATCSAGYHRNMAGRVLAWNEPAEFDIGCVVVDERIQHRKDETMVHLRDFLDITGNRNRFDLIQRVLEVVRAEWCVIDADVEAAIADENVNRKITAATNWVGLVRRAIFVSFTVGPAAVG